MNPFYRLNDLEYSEYCKKEKEQKKLQQTKLRKILDIQIEEKEKRKIQEKMKEQELYRTNYMNIRGLTPEIKRHPLPIIDKRKTSMNFEYINKVNCLSII